MHGAILTVLLLAHAPSAECQTTTKPSSTGIDASAYPSLQAALDANPGRMIRVPCGDHRISKKLRIASEGTGLCGFGRIVQTNPAAPIIEIEHARDVRIHDLTLTRAEGKQQATANGVFCWDSHDVTLERLRIVGNRSGSAAIELREASGCTVRDCRIVDYKRITIDDRTGSEHYGYAFHCIDGTGVLVRESRGTVLEGNRIVERDLLPTREIKKRHKLGTLTKGRHPSSPGTLALKAFLRGYVNNWHQGSAIVVTGPTKTSHTRITGNTIVNAAQGVDLHCDRLVCTGNVIDHAMIGIKATHGSRNLLIANNLITHVDLWGILLNPGTASHEAEPAEGDTPARPANVDGGTIIANNLITDYGFGHEYWNWGGATSDQGGSYAIAIRDGQLPTNPPLRDVLFHGNMVYDTGRDKVLVDGKPTVVGPRYRYAVFVGSWHGKGYRDASFPKGLHFLGNVFHPGTKGVANVSLEP